MTAEYVVVIIDRLLLASLLFVVVTGVIVDRLDLNEFRLHSWSGYAMAVLAAIHVGLHRRTTRDRRAWTTGPSVARPDIPEPPGRLSVSARVGRSAHEETAASKHEGVSRRSVLASLFAAAGGAAVGWYARSETSHAAFEGDDVGLFYHRESSLGVRSLRDGLINWGRRPDRYKPSVEAGVVDLPVVSASPDMTVAEALVRRRSLRDYADRSLALEELAWLVQAATGITSDDGRRTAPSAGALYPIEMYVAVDRLAGVEPGLYHVDILRRALQPVKTGSVAGDVMLAGIGQDFLRQAPVVLILTGVFQRTRWKYHQRHYRYVVWEAGHIAQNVSLAAEAAGLGACVVGAFLDGSLNDLLQVDGREEAALGLIAVGPR